MFRWLLTFLFGILFGVSLPGCDPSQQMVRFMETPAAQAMVNKWEWETDATNPRGSFVLGTIAEVRLDGVRVGSKAEGWPGSGMTPEQIAALAQLTEIAKDWQAFKAALEKERAEEGKPPIVPPEPDGGETPAVVEPPTEPVG